MELVTGKAGTPHVSSADDGRRIAGEVGAGSYVLKTGGGLAPSLVDANTVRFATGDMVVQGRHIGLTAPEDVKVASGTQGKKRTDYICVHYKRDVSGANPTLVETCEWKVLQGTPGTDATAPTVPAGSILDGDAEATVPVASVDFDGLTTGEPRLLIPTLTPLADLGDSVSRDVGDITPYNIASGLFLNIYECLAGVCVGGNVSPSVSVSTGGTLLMFTTKREFMPRGMILIRGVFPNRQSGVYVSYGSDGHTIKVTVEQAVSLAQSNTLNFLIPVAWEL